ncbi:glycosyltransferase family 4 protein [Synoicihabitans lomoniglobus]|uniref:Glycosyltransferase family 4 protein n=1 Tax=Synoicihabitans lomoniglobus TaxID=2909285 RepID=A0AAF0CSM1_9BACT|nr:glycosyltransferase family 4 protein [Opitutaceae bacterium LMO-M01]WED67279.1 glycosyltransferase family 4 protein [Opitutaceae bacterium LMO-M01]
MRILHLSAYDELGGAAKAAFRLHCALVDAGEESLMLVRQKDSNRADVMGPNGWLQRVATKSQRRAERLLVLPRAVEEFSVGSLADGLVKRVRALRPDVVHVHWVSHGFLRLETLAELDVPIVWTMHDMWAFTGGCHYAGDCERYRVGCGSCPILETKSESDASRKGVERRRKMGDLSKIRYVAPSQWIAQCASQSAVLTGADVRVIPNTVGVREFSSVDKLQARRRLRLPEEGRLVLAGAMAIESGDRKGAEDLQQALRLLARMTFKEGVPQVVIFGTPNRRRLQRNGLTVHELGYVKGERAMSDLYAAADVFTAPSKQDNLPNTVMEAMAAGTPVVACRVGGIPDMIDDEVNGLLVAPGDVTGLAEAVARLLNDEPMRLSMGGAAREKVERCYSREVVTAAYRALYVDCGVRA